MSTIVETDVAVVGTGVSGTLVARELARAGRRTLLLERGGFKRHREQLADDAHMVDSPAAAPNHESHPDGQEYPWWYVYGVGGSTLHWAGVSPRFLPSDFELRSRYGVGRDWPLTYSELEPFYEEAERTLAVAGGGDNPLFRGRGPFPQPPHPYSPVDRLIRPYFDSYVPLPQARPTRAANGRPACCGSARCGLCPVDARWSALHTLADERILESPDVKLLERTVVARLRARRGRAVALECVKEDGTRVEVRPGTVVLAANGIENAAILLRSDLGDGGAGQWLYDHEHRLIYVTLPRQTGHGSGTTLATGISYDYAEGAWRSERGSLLVYPYNPGRLVAEDLMDELVAGNRGSEVRRRLRERFDRTLVVDTLGEDLPRRDRVVELSPNKDALGLPRNRIRYPSDSEYLRKSYRHLFADLERRLRPIGARIETSFPVARGAHQLGTCPMGERDGVVDPDQRHHWLENLYVTGGSSFPSYSAHHPTLTIAALAIRLGRHLVRSDTA